MELLRGNFFLFIFAQVFENHHVESLKLERKMKKLLSLLFCLTLAVSTSQAQTKDLKEEPVLDVCEEMPQFPGGMSELMTYLSQSIRYPVEAQKQKIEGRCIVKFIVEKDGTLSSFDVARSSHPLLDAEALRVVQAMPTWKPGKQKGKPVRVSFNLPVSFRLK